MSKATYLIFAILVSAPLFGQSKFACGGRLYIEPMPNGLNQYIASKVIHDRLPFTVTEDPKKADYIMRGTAEHKKPGWAKTIFVSGGIDNSNEGSVTIANKDGDVLFSASAGDRSIWWGYAAKHGQQKVAARIVNRIKKQVDKTCK
jgi:hypothetical protein